MIDEKIICFGSKNELKSDYGPVSFGTVISGAIIQQSGKSSKDLLVGRCWEGVYLYPSINLKDEESNISVIKVTKDLSWLPAILPADWNRDGKEDLIISNYTGFLYFFKSKGELPELFFEMGEMLKDSEKNLLFNIPYENPEHPVLNNLDGYFDTAFFSYPFPVLYPFEGHICKEHPCDIHLCKGHLYEEKLGEGKYLDLIIGDWGGNLWWLSDLSNGSGKPVYSGERYYKDSKEIVTDFGRKVVKEYGMEYVKPHEKLCDENGIPFLLGDGYDSGVEYCGGNTRPVLYKNHVTGSNDLLVLAGMNDPKLIYLQRVNDTAERKPVFKNLGEVKISGFEFKPFAHIHAKIIVFNNDKGLNDLLISDGSKIAVITNSGSGNIKPDFIFSHYISAKNAPVGGNNFTEILTDYKSMKRYILDNTSGNTWELREVTNNMNTSEISYCRHLLHDQNGIFRVEGETDPQGGKKYYGFNRAVKWNYDGSSKQHLIVGTDKGNFYLLVDAGDFSEDSGFKFKSIGPLKDCEGKIIRIHSRSCACGIDLNGDGIEDLILGGVSYQLGIKTDPNPGGAFYYTINKGVDENGIPILGRVMPLKIEGCNFNFKVNSHIHIQVIDIDNDGEKEVILSNQYDQNMYFKGCVFKVMKDKIGLYYTGTYLECFTTEHNLLDIDGDGKPELVFAGGENGVGYYCRMLT